MSSIMENEMFSVPLDIGSQNSMVLGGMPNSLVRSNSFNFNSQNHLTRASAEFPLLSELQEEPICDIHPDLPTTSHYRFFDSNGLFTSLGRTGVDNISFQGQLEGGTSISATSLTSLLAARRSPQENLNDLAVSISSIYPLEVPRSNIVNNFPNDLNSSFATSVNCGYDEVLGSVTGKWHFEKSRAPPESPGETHFTAGFLPFSCIGDLNANGWIPPTGLHVTADSPYVSSKSSHELSLSLARSQPAIIGEANVPDQCSEISCSGETCHYLKATKLQPEHQSHNSNNLSLSFGSYGAAQFSQLISGSKYLHAIQEILAQIASFSLENLDERSYVSGERMFRDNVRFPSSSSDGRGMPPMYSDESSDVDGSFKSQVDPSSRRQGEAKKTQLLTLLQVVDDRYSQCLDEIHTVVSAFHAATELNPPMHARFALQTVSSLYKNLRERISNQILSMGANSDAVECTRGKEVSFEDSFVKEQWALQQLKRKEHQIWRPQRGLPEKSVAVLRTWMFQNFLHPYPKDAEKHLLAVKSGLTRSQVSNWFINARVRLWKPMIEEMYREMNRRKTRRIAEGNNGNHRSQLSMNNQRFSLN